MNTARKKSSAWLVVVGCFLLTFFAVAIVSNTAALFMPPIVNQFGFDPASYSVIYLVASICSALGALWLAPRLQKGNMKMIMIICAVIGGAAYATMGLCRKLWQFFLVFGICNLGIAGVSQLPVSMLITSWFIDKRSVAMSLAFTGGGIGGAVWAKVFGNLIADGRWATCYFIGGGIVIITSIIIITFFIKEHPSKYGQEAYTNGANIRKTDAKDATSKDVWLGVKKEVAIKTPAFFMLALVVFLVGCLAAGVATHALYYLTSIGWEVTAASSVLSLFSIVSVVGMLVGGVLFDKLGPRGGTLIVVTFAIIGLVGLLLAKQAIFGYVYAIAFALAMMMPKILPALLTSFVFGVQDYGSIYSLLNLFFLIGCALGSVITGIISKATGYKVAWMVYIVFCILIFVCTSIALSSGKKLREQYPSP